jgi:hypothetical protein
MSRFKPGPRKDWGQWAAKRDQKIKKPRRLKTCKDRIKPSTNADMPKPTSSPAGEDRS